jgi:hypothetical protein
MNNLFKYFITFLAGSAFSSFLFELRMLNPVMRRELLLYIGNNESYFLTFGLVYISFILLVFIVNLFLFKRKEKKK